MVDRDEEILKGKISIPIVSSANRTTKPFKNSHAQKPHLSKEQISAAAKISSSTTEIEVLDKIVLSEYVRDPYTGSQKERFEIGGRSSHTIKGALGVRRHFTFGKGSELIIQLNDEDMTLLSKEDAMKKTDNLKKHNAELLQKLQSRDRRLKIINRTEFLMMQCWIFGRGLLIKLFDGKEVRKLHQINARRLGDPIIDTDNYYNIEGVLVDGQPLSKKSMIYAIYNDDEISPHTTGFGYSELESIIDEAETLDILLNEDLKEIAKSNWLSSVILQISTMGLDNATASAKITAIVNAVAKAGKIIGINEEVIATPIPMEADFTGLNTTIEKLETIVYKTLQVPQFMVQSESAANKATAVQSATQFLNGVVADDQNKASDTLTEQHYDPYLIENKELLKDENGKQIEFQDELPFHVRRVFNQAKASEFVDLASSVALLKREGIWDTRKANEILGSEEVTPRIEAELKKLEQKMKLEEKENPTKPQDSKETKPSVP